MTVLLCRSGEAGRFSFESDMDPTGWWVSEKLDGVRGRREGNHLISRNGNAFPTPDYFFNGFPDMPLDGEIWLGRGRFEEASSIVRNGSQDKGWGKMKYLVFDIPDPKLGPVEKRWEILAQAVQAANVPNLMFVPQTRCKGREHLLTILDLVVAQGAEGLMLRRPGSLYEPKRSGTILKLKKFIDDDAVVYGYEAIEINTPGKEHLRGAMGALLCKMKHPKTGEAIDIKVGTGFSDNQRLHPPKIGDVITFKYQEFTTKDHKPRFPSFVGVRADR